ncbi:2-aminoethylphosphonate ABC transporter substrate-binding protein [Mycobacterium spongiae]|uniref:2-aminoethylphosphonate ABC transporter substrate-binding protein n=1 Tax=Mycobacterium spongiae TaxID=886343 RepID=A0A975K0T1_9MYCO|nr:2-aminoethylphosphonate ABC transporter substrate-binding protein [Mycobacterium spongiae]QUR68078.1 2-aminoethylphosphonate ABC transporter substrate-binding protein [Mycobacterium spongiae]
MPFRAARAIASTIVAAVLLLTACGGTGHTGAGTITVYSADGLAAWYKDRFVAFTRQTGIPVNLVETGSSEAVARITNERHNTQADVVITLPPFIQDIAMRGLLVSHGADVADIPDSARDAQGRYVNIVNNYLTFIVNNEVAVKPRTWSDLLAPRFKGKLQYSTPGQAGDGTAVLVLLTTMWGKDRALDYLRQLQANNVGPSKSTGSLQEKTSRGDILVANGDVQMNLRTLRSGQGNFTLFMPADDDGQRRTVAVPYAAGMVKGAPHPDRARRLLSFLLSPESQRTIGPVAVGFPTLPAAQDSVDDEQRRVMAGIDVVSVDWTSVAQTFRADMAAYDQAVHR